MMLADKQDNIQFVADFPIGSEREHSKYAVEAQDYL